MEDDTVPLKGYLEYMNAGLKKYEKDKRVFQVAGFNSLRIRKNKKGAIHTGGETQLLFGIQGKRWDSYGFYNSSWTSCLPEETPMGQIKLIAGVTGKKTLLGNGELSCFITF